MAETFGGHSETLTIQKAPDRKEVAGDSFSPQKIEQRRLQSQINNLKEAQEDKKEILEDLLMNYPDEDFFYYEDGELMPFSEYIGEEGSDFVHIKTRESLITKISAINESLSETRIEKEIKRLDDLIMGTHKNNPNIRLILMEMRSQLSGYGKIDGYDFYGEELQDMLFFLEKNDTENLTSADYVQGVYNTFNFCRKHLAVDAKMVLAGIKDLTSSQIYQYGDGKNDEAPFEAWLEESIIDNNYIPDFAEPAVLETGRVAAGTVAGGIDGVLDYFGAVVDLNLVPDEVIRSLMDLVPTILREYKQIFDEILDGIDGPAEVGYILGYVVGLLAGAHFFPAGVVWGGPLKMVMGKIKTLNISEKAFEKFKSNIVLIRNTAEDKFGKYAPELEAFQDKASKVNKVTKKSSETATDTIKTIKGSKEQLEASRKMLNSATNTAILADIFGDKIQGQVDEIANTEFAMRIYEEQIINGNDFLIDEVEDGLYKTSGELQYNLIRVKERFAEIREVMENEVMPIVSKISEYIIGGKIEEYANLIDKVKKSSEYDELTKLIISKYKK